MNQLLQLITICMFWTIISTSYATHASDLTAIPLNIKYDGEIFGLMDYLKQYSPELTVLKPNGKIIALQLKLDLEGVYLDDMIEAIATQTNKQINLIYNKHANSIKIIFTPKLLVKESIKQQSLKWQNGETPLPILHKDGLIRFPYGEYMPSIICQPLNLCDIELQAGEEIYGIVIGDSERWNDGDHGIPIIYSGAPPKLTPHLVLKPSQSGLNTSLLITTSKRTYMIKLQSSSHEYTARIGFYYPNENIFDIPPAIPINNQQFNQASSPVTQNNNTIALPLINPANLDYRYTISKNHYPWCPIKIFNDGISTYIQLPASITAQNLPTICINNHLQDSSAVCELVNFRYINNFYIIDQIFQQAKLINGFGKYAESITLKHHNTLIGMWEKIFSE